MLIYPRDLLVSSGLCKNLNEAIDLINSQGCWINNVRVTNVNCYIKQTSVDMLNKPVYTIYNAN